MGFLDKVKNMFIEEIEEEEEVKKEVIKVEIPSPKIEEPKEVKLETVTEKREEKFVFPIYFDDQDFEKIEEVKQIPKSEPVRTVEKTPVKEVYGIKKEEEVKKKNFTPTPIISPVYGVLDKNYRKEEIKTRKKVSSYEYRGNEKVDIDDVRKKAYGTLENELEDNLFKKTSVLFNDELETGGINIYEEPRHGKDNFELDDSFEDNMTLEELNRDYDETESSYISELNDSDLFNLIDSMYEKGND